MNRKARYRRETRLLRRKVFGLTFREYMQRYFSDVSLFLKPEESAAFWRGNIYGSAAANQAQGVVP